MKRILLPLVSLLLCLGTVLAQNTTNDSNGNKPGETVEMSPEMKAYVNHLMGLDKPQPSASKAPRKVSSSSWSYPSSTPSTPFGGGTGTSSNPYLISTPQHLANLAYMVNNGTSYSGYYFKMTDDIVLNSNVLAADGSLNSGTFKEWTPIGSSSNYFKGTFDGDGHYVSGVYINASGVGYKGLFGRSSNGLITKLGLIDSYICGSQYVGGILGHSDYASVTFCYNKATVIGSFDIGGIIGDVCGSGGSSYATSGSVITACVNYGLITETGSHCAGGITGYANSGTTISYCVNYGTITSTSGNKIAGIYGEGSGCTCNNCINVGTISISSSASYSSYGAISYDGSPSDCYYLSGSCSQAGGGTSKTATEFADGTVLSLLDPSGTYFMQGANGYPVLKGVGEGASATTYKTVTVGTGTSSTDYRPYANDSYYSTSQCIYTASEINCSGTITRLAYNVASTDSFTPYELKIYMGHKSGLFSSSSDYMTSANLTLVYSGTPTLGTSTGWEALTLTNPFVYNGTDNLVIVVTKKMSTTASAQYYYTDTSGYVLSRKSSSSTDYGDITSTVSYTKQVFRPNIQLTFGKVIGGGYNYQNAPSGIEVVDLGLPSGTLWANMNVGATSVTGIGSYYGWGGLTANSISYSTATTYTSSIDAATQNWGTNWLMPSIEQLTELKNSCTWTYCTSYNGTSVNGMKVTGPNGKEIFLPTTGLGGSSNGWGNYWSSTVNSSTNAQSLAFETTSSSVEIYSSRDKDNGQMIRPIYVGPIGTPSVKTTDVSGMSYAVYASNNVVGKKNTQITVPINLKNSNAIASWQADLELPTGFTIATDGYGDPMISVSGSRTTSARHAISTSTLSSGATRILYSSSSNKTISGTDGEVATITLNVADGVEAGDYPVIFKNIVMSEANETGHKVDQVVSKVAIKNFTLGDVNDDGEINAQDLVAVVNYILENPTSGNIREAADLNNDGNIDAMDYVAEVNLILSDGSSVKEMAKVKGTEMSATSNASLSLESFSIAPGEEMDVVVSLNDLNNEYVCCQFDMALPKGISVVDAESVIGSHSVAYRTLDDGSTRILLASPSNKVIRQSENGTICLTLKADKNMMSGQYALDATNTMFVKANAQSINPASASLAFTVGDATGISNVNSNADNDKRYNIAGQPVNASAKGLIIVNGKKTIVK